MILPFLITFFGFTHPGPLRVYQTRIAGWQLRMDRDTFTGLTTCDVQAGQMRIFPHQLRLQLGRRTDTAQAVLRIDNGRPFSLHGVDFPLAPTSDVALANPSGGVIDIPIDQVHGAKRLYVELSPRTRLRTFDVSTVAVVLDGAIKRGCWTGSPPRVIGPAA